MPMSINRSAATGDDAPRDVQDALAIAYVNAAEAEALLRTELDRFLALVGTLGPDEWDKPTACTAWSVRDILAHQAGSYASATGYVEMIRQLVFSKPKSGQLPEDALNALQLRERAGKSPAELLAELRRVAPIGIQKWAHQFRVVKLFALPRPDGGSLSLRHLMWVIHSRDTWMQMAGLPRW